MAKDFKDIDIRDILNYDHAEIAVMARYERIMQNRTIEAMNGLSERLDNVVNKLTGVIDTIYRVGQLAQEKADSAIAAANTASSAQGRQQAAMTWLTRALVLCTAAYTIINGVVAWEMREGNKIQSDIAAAAHESNKVQTPLPLPQPVEPGY